MDALQSHRVEMLSIAVALVAIGAGTAYYFYVTRPKKPKGFIFTFYYLFWISFILLRYNYYDFAIQLYLNMETDSSCDIC